MDKVLAALEEDKKIFNMLSGFLKDAPAERPAIGDSIGNYDDTFYDGYNAALYDLAEKLRGVFHK